MRATGNNQQPSVLLNGTLGIVNRVCESSGMPGPSDPPDNTLSRDLPGGSWAFRSKGAWEAAMA